MSIPKSMQETYDKIAPLITAFCGEKLSEDHARLCLLLLEKLCRKRPSPLLKGRAPGWAAGIVYVIAANNFIFDRSNPYHMPASELTAPFGVAASTASVKASALRDMFDINFFNAEWILPKFMDDNPAIWLVEVDGFVVDIRAMPLTMQRRAFELGIIPYIPTKRTTAPGSQAAQSTISGDDCVFDFRVQLGRSCSRVIQCSGRHTMEDLHLAIQSAFEFDDDHLYAFFMDGKKWSGHCIHSPYSERKPSADKVRIGRAGFNSRKSVLYLFDFGDEWLFKVTPIAISDDKPHPLRPLVLEGKGNGTPPEQYSMFD